MRHFFRSSAVSAILTSAIGFALFALPVPRAEAIIPVSVDTCLTASQSAFYSTCASESTLYAQFVYLTSGRNISMTGAASAATGDGLMPLLREIADNGKENNEALRQMLANQDLANRALTDQSNAQNAMYKATMPISQGACTDLSLSGGFGGNGGGSGPTLSDNSTKHKDKAQKDAQKNYLTPHTEDDYIASLMMGVNQEFCTTQDVANHMPGCTSTGSLPGANTDPSSLVRAAGPEKDRIYTIKWPSSDSSTSSSSVTGISGQKGYPQYSAAMAYIQMAAPFPAPKSTKNAYKTMAGRRYLIEQRRYNSRALAVVSAFLDIASDSAAMPEDSELVKNTWNGSDGSWFGFGPKQQGSLREHYKEVYPNKKVPDAPSERELLHLMVKSQFDNTTSAYDLAAGGDNLQRRILQVEKINALIGLKQLDRLNMQNLLLANLLSNQLDPVTRADLVEKAGAGATASSSSGTGGNAK